MSSDNSLTFEEENNAPMCKDCGGLGCPECLGYGYMMGISEEKNYPSDYEPSYYYYDNDDDEYLYDDEDARDAYYEDDDLVTVKLTPRARFYIWRTYILPAYMGRIRWRLWMLKYRVKGKLFRLLHKNPYDEIPF